MKTQYLAVIAAAALAGIVGSSVYSVRSGDQCPQASAASVTALFAPCQAYAAATGPTITAEQAMDMGLPSLAPPASAPVRQPVPSPAQVVAEDFQSIAQEHATTGVATSKH